jgi:hypothetical protein
VVAEKIGNSIGGHCGPETGAEMESVEVEEGRYDIEASR